MDLRELEQDISIRNVNSIPLFSLNIGKSIIIWISLLFFSIPILSADEINDLINLSNTTKNEYSDYIKKFSPDDQRAKLLKKKYELMDKKIFLLKIISSENDFSKLSPKTEIEKDFLSSLSSSSYSPNAKTDYMLGWLNFKYYSLNNALSFFKLSLLKYSSYSTPPEKVYISIALVYFKMAEAATDDQQEKFFNDCTKYLNMQDDLQDKDLQSIRDTILNKINAYKELKEIKKSSL